MSTPNAQFELDELRDARTKAEKESDTAKRSRTIGLAGVLLGLLLMIPVWPVGLLLLLAGGLAAVTQAMKASAAQARITELDGKIKAIRARLY